MVRALLFASILAAAAPAGLVAADGGAPLAEEGARSAKTVFVNYKVSSKSVAINQPVRLEFTTIPKQIEGVDVAGVVANGIELAGGGAWRLLARPVVTEHEKLKTVTVVVSLLPRVTGELRLPQFPMSWLVGDPLPDFSTVSVASSIVVGGETRRLPAEYEGLGGVPWGGSIEEAKERLPKETTWEGRDDPVTATVPGGLVLVFRGGLLAEGSLRTEGLPLAEARLQFVTRWGLPLAEDAQGMTWSLGWTRITAGAGDAALPAGSSTAGGTPASSTAAAIPAPAPSIIVRFARDDQRNRVIASKVRESIFDRLEGVPAKGPEPRGK